MDQVRAILEGEMLPVPEALPQADFEVGRSTLFVFILLMPL